MRWGARHTAGHSTNFRYAAPGSKLKSGDSLHARGWTGAVSLVQAGQAADGGSSGYRGRREATNAPVPPPYINTNGSPSAKSADTMITLGRPT